MMITRDILYEEKMNQAMKFKGILMWTFWMLEHVGIILKCIHKFSNVFTKSSFTYPYVEKANFLTRCHITNM